MIDQALDAARRAALAGGNLLKSRLGRAREVRLKGRRDLVTEWDLAAQGEILNLIKQKFPDHNFMLEEEAARPELSGPVWIIDPLDGTTNYVHGLPIYGVSICLAVDGRLTVGVVFDPERGEVFSAASGRGVWLNGRPARVSEVASLAEGLVVTGFPYDLEAKIEPALARFRRLLELSQGVRRLGSAALDLAYVACGRRGGVGGGGRPPGGLAAGALLVEEAGGQVSDFGGGPFELQSGRIVASNGSVHQEIVTALKI